MSTQPHTLARLEEFLVRQRITMMVNRYEIRALGPGGGDGELLAVAQQKRLAFREQVTFFADEGRRVTVFSFKARQVMDLGATYDVLDADGTPIGLFRKDFAKSLLRSTWHLEAAGVRAEGKERSLPLAVLRRLSDAFPFPFHFDFVDPGGGLVMSSERAFTLRDRYLVRVPGARIDGRVAAAMAVALDAMQER